MGRWTRRALITSGVVAGGALIVGVAIRPGECRARLSAVVGADGEHLIHTWKPRPRTVTRTSRSRKASCSAM